MTANQLAHQHLAALTELLARCAPDHIGRPVLEQRVAEARAAVEATR